MPCRPHGAPALWGPTVMAGSSREQPGENP